MTIENIAINTMKVSFELTAETSGYMPPFSSSIFRGMIGKVLFERSCIFTEKQCEKCELVVNCAYCKYFEPPSEVFAPHLAHKTKYITPPFAIESPMFENNEWHIGEKKILTIIFFTNDESMFFELVDIINVIGQLGVGKDRIEFKVSRITQHLQHDGQIELWNNNTHHMNNIALEKRVWNKPDKNISKLLIQLVTPHRFVKQGKLVEELTIEIFFENILRRLELLAALYGEYTSDISDRNDGIVESHIEMYDINLFWEEWQRYSARNRKEMKFGGLVGSFVLSGNLTPILPYLQFASYAHIGKQVAFGLGKSKLYIPYE